MDYESEEDGGDDGEDKEDQGDEEEEAEEKVEDTLEESQPESAGVRTERKKKRAKRGGGEEALNQMRVNTVLESNPAIERYCYDLQHELWCEVSLYMVHKQIKKVRV